MRRREFLINAGLGSLLAGGGLSGLMPRSARADDCVMSDLPKTLVNVMLQGGADFRFLFMPAPSYPDTIYMDLLWEARRRLYDPSYADYAQMFENEYLLVQDPLSNQSFGVFKDAAWLASEFSAGRVALVANAVCSTNRRHDQSILNADAGIPWLEQLDFDRNGWGGRLVEQLPQPANVVELGERISLFGKGSQASDRLQRVVHARDLRNMSLAGVDSALPVEHARNVLARALHSWYEAKNEDGVASDSPHQVFFRHRRAIQEFGLKVDQRVAQCGDLPESLQMLSLGDEDFAQQCRNLYDACQMPDVLAQRVVSMNLGSWDTHDNQYSEITSNISDLFGDGGGLSTALAEVETLPWSERPPREQLLFYFASDFGRQLVANGTLGTDHGSGTYSILAGHSVRGGVYGELFPAAEARSNTNGQIALETSGADITGLTSTERLIAAAADWVQPGSSANVAPDATSSMIEIPGLLDTLFSS